ELVKQFLGFIKLWDTRGDSDTGKRSTIGTRLRHDAGLTELQVPQVAVEEHGVESCGTAWLQKLHHAVFIDGESFIRVLTTTGHLWPGAAVCCGGNDVWIHGGWGHADQDDGGHPGPLGVTGLGIRLAVGQRDELW